MKPSNRDKVLLGLLGVLAAGVVVWSFTKASQPFASEVRVVANSTSTAACSLSKEIRNNIGKLRAQSPESYEAGIRLIEFAKDSSQCRKEVIDQLLRAMDKPNSSASDEQDRFALWSKGSALLGELKAVEALDLLIDNLDFNDGLFSASMTHQPVVLGIERMGTVAVPKLSIALQRHPKRDIRLAAALCLATIGGKEAMEALKNALNSETDQCIGRFIALSLPTSPASMDRKPLLSSSAGDVLRQRLLAFRCDN